jgi:mannose-1-phosphate guanylyltransferase
VIFEYSRLGPGVWLKDKLVFGRYCVDKNGAAIDVQAAALDWLITDSRQIIVNKEPNPKHQAIVDLLSNGES